MVLGFLDGRLFPTPNASDIDSALQTLADAVPPHTQLLCSPELAEVGKLYGFTPSATPAGVRAIRAQLAMVLAMADLAPQASGELLPLMEASAVFWDNRPWERLPADESIAVSILGAFSATYEVAVMGAAGETFGVALYPKAGSIAKLVRAVDAGRPDQAVRLESVSVTFDEEPRFAARAVEAFCGLPRVPIGFATRKGTTTPLLATDALAAAATMFALARLKGDPGETATYTMRTPGAELVATAHLPRQTSVQGTIQRR